jgi:hypothetical protein
VAVSGLVSCAVLTAASGAKPTIELSRVFTAESRAAIASGRAAVEVLPDSDVDLSVIGAVRTTVTDQQLVSRYREIEQLQRGAYIPVVQRFSNPPRLGDLDPLALDDDDLEELRDCRQGHCDIKLASSEMNEIRAAIRPAGSRWKAAAQVAFRRVLLARARAHLAHGFAGALPYDDHRDQVSPAAEFEAVLRGCSLPGVCRPTLPAQVRSCLTAPAADVESFLFWSKDVLGDAKPIFSISQVTICGAALDDGRPMIATAQVFASHYLTASLSLTTAINTSDGARYLVYARRSRADVFGGAFGGLLRRIVHKRVRKEGSVALDALRQKLEGGLPQ